MNRIESDNRFVPSLSIQLEEKGDASSNSCLARLCKKVMDWIRLIWRQILAYCCCSSKTQEPPKEKFPPEARTVRSLTEARVRLLERVGDQKSPPRPGALQLENFNHERSRQPLIQSPEIRRDPPKQEERKENVSLYPPLKQELRVQVVSDDFQIVLSAFGSPVYSSLVSSQDIIVMKKERSWVIVQHNPHLAEPAKKRLIDKLVQLLKKSTVKIILVPAEQSQINGALLQHSELTSFPSLENSTGFELQGIRRPV